MPIRAGLSFSEYLKIDAINHSTLKLFAKSAAHAQQEILHPSAPTPAQDLGQAIHTAILEPARFRKEYVLAPKVDRRTKEGKAAWAAFEDAHPNATVLKEEDHSTCKGISESAWSHGIISQLLSGTGGNELVLLWDDEETAAPCKARLDRITVYNGFTCILDFKSTVEASIWAFARACAKYGYHSQGAFYLDGCKALEAAPVERRFLNVAFEKEPPYACAVYELTSASIEQGRMDYRKWMGQLLEARKTDLWPGYPTEIQQLELPKWAFTSEEWV